MALGFLIAAVVAFGLFQGLVEYRSFDPYGERMLETRGYEVWRAIYESGHAGYLDDFLRFFIAGLVLGAVITMASPFLVNVLGRSRLLWWVGICASAMATIAVCGCMLWMQYASGQAADPEFEYGPGYFFLLIFPLLNFIGLLCIRKQH
ncbi:hypothetical protein ACFQY0_07480 [Haloferula chungangensis]|uniref:Uncharacterized protein n=1 Tax=Haloferula chungangensis TaxID=1048331 RepID=A0ABW2L3U9_9BACT